jgi:hypothetical protein
VDSHSLFQNALSRTYVPELVRLHARPELDHQRHPVIVEGDQALVARLIRSDGTRLALRVAASPETGKDWRLRYAAMPSGVPASVSSYIPRAIDVVPGGFTMGDASHAAVVSEWVDGPTVLQAVDRAGRAGNGAVLRAMAASLREFAIGLRQARVVHGDLAADNLMMRPNGDLVCIDLDGLTWPDAQLGPTGSGTPGYRHPGGAGSATERDAFAVLVQYTSLLVLADDPDLRRSYGDPISAHGGAILFSAWDLADPATSQVFADARERVDPETQHLVDRLREACISRPGQSPAILAEIFALPDEVRPTTGSPEDAPLDSSWNINSVVERLKTQYGEPPASERPATPAPAASDWSRWLPSDRTERFPAPAPADAPSSGAVPLHRLDEDRQRLRQAIAAKDEPEILRLAARLGDDPVAQMYKIDVEHVLAEGIQARIARAAEKGRDEDVLSLAHDVERRHLPLNRATRNLIRRSKERIAVRGRLEAALAADDRPALSDLAVSGDLVVLGDTDRASLQKVLRALEWPSLQRALATDDDLMILEWFDEELFGAPGTLPDEAHRRIALARQRTQWVQEVRSALKRRRVRDLASLFLAPPEGGPERLSAAERQRTERLIERQAALDELQLAMKSGDDNAVLSALNTIERVGARIDDRFTWGTVQGVVERATVIEDIVTAATAEPVDDRQLAHLLPVAKSLGLAHDPRLRDELAFERLERLVLRGAAVRRIRNAITQNDDAAIRQAAYPDVADAHAALTFAERERVEAAVQRTNPRRAAS